MRRSAGLSLLGVALALSSCGLEVTRGSGNVIPETRALSGFRSVSMSGSARLVLERGGSESLTITADDNLLPLLSSEVRAGELELGGVSGSAIAPSRQIVYTVSFKDLDAIHVSGSGEVEAAGIDSPHLAIVVSGSGDVAVRGRADALQVELSGSGRYEGDGLESRSASIEISGSADAVVNASEQLAVQVSGSGSVEYRGEPRLTQEVSGSGTVRQRP